MRADKRASKQIEGCVSQSVGQFAKRYGCSRYASCYELKLKGLLMGLQNAQLVAQLVGLMVLLLFLFLFLPLPLPLVFVAKGQ